MWLPLVHPLLGTWPATQAYALTGDQTGDTWFVGSTQPTEPHQPGHNTDKVFYSEKLTFFVVEVYMTMTALKFVSASLNFRPVTFHLKTKISLSLEHLFRKCIIANCLSF